MKTIAKWQLALGLTAITAVAGVAQPAAASNAGKLTFTIHVRNYADVDSRTLSQAEKVSSRIFQNAGVVSQWAVAPVPGQDSYNSDQQVIGLSDIWVNILPVSMYGRLNLMAGVTGLAPGGSPNRALAYIFYNRVEEMQKMDFAAYLRNDAESVSTIADLLGSAMAHEIGHILLNLDVHSRSGIMRGNWDLGVLTDIAHESLYFTKDQQKVIQGEVTRRAHQQLALVASVIAEGDTATPPR